MRLWCRSSAVIHELWQRHQNALETDASSGAIYDFSEYHKDKNCKDVVLLMIADRKAHLTSISNLNRTVYLRTTVLEISIETFSWLFNVKKNYISNFYGVSLVFHFAEEVYFDKVLISAWTDSSLWHIIKAGPFIGSKEKLLLLHYYVRPYTNALKQGIKDSSWQARSNAPRRHIVGAGDNWFWRWLIVPTASSLIQFISLFFGSQFGIIILTRSLMKFKDEGAYLDCASL